MAYAPGTLFRLSDKYTSILLKDGSVYEVKNRDTNTKAKYDSLDMWLSNHPDLPLTVDASRGCGVVIGSDTHGFNYPRENENAFFWVQWCYSRICEAAPHLLKNEDLKAHYNRMVELVLKEKDTLRHYYFRLLGPLTYSSSLLNWQPTEIIRGKEVPSKLCGYPGGFGPFNIYDCTNLTPTQEEIIQTYKKILDIIKPDLEPYINKKREYQQKKRIIALKQRQIKHLQKKIHEFEERVNTAKNYIIQLNKDNEEFGAN
jgi:hypothetical protein